jgi:hypothetical protein
MNDTVMIRFEVFAPPGRTFPSDERFGPSIE